MMHAAAAKKSKAPWLERKRQKRLSDAKDQKDNITRPFGPFDFWNLSNEQRFLLVRDAGSSHTPSALHEDAA